jgi:hypothetical protein
MAVRYWRVTKATARLMENHLEIRGGEVHGWNIFSPITHSHHIPKWIPERLNTHTFWLGLDFDWIYSCDEVWVYMQPGWVQSYGVGEEIQLARDNEIPVRFFDYKTYREVDGVMGTLWDTSTHSEVY